MCGGLLLHTARERPSRPQPIAEKGRCRRSQAPGCRCRQRISRSTAAAVRVPACPGGPMAEPTLPQPETRTPSATPAAWPVDAVRAAAAAWRRRRPGGRGSTRGQVPGSSSGPHQHLSETDSHMLTPIQCMAGLTAVQVSEGGSSSPPLRRGSCMAREPCARRWGGATVCWSQPRALRREAWVQVGDRSSVGADDADTSLRARAASSPGGGGGGGC
jgi:hypothetical protein